MPSVENRTCTKCAIEKNVDDFHKDSRAPGGFRRQCKRCRSEHMKEFYASKADEVKGRMSAYRRAHPDRVRLSEQRRYEKHRDKRIALAVEAVHIRRVRIESAVHDKGITTRALRIRDGTECFYCDTVLDFERKPRGEGVGHGATIEHVIPIAKGGLHVWENVVLACRDCNYRKGSRLPDELCVSPETTP